MMNRVNRGDVYFLKSPLNSSVGKEHAKRIAYLLGTVPSRPVVVIREPAEWDAYGEVMVVPAIHNENEPGILIGSRDRFGRETDSTYNFIPHAVHTVPVTRLGAYLGRLEPDELDKVVDSVKWVISGCKHTLTQQYNVIEYSSKIDHKRDLIAAGDKVSAVIRDFNPPTLNIDGNMTLTEGNDESTAVDLDINFESAISPTIADMLYKDDTYHVKPKKKVDTNKEFPKSCFNREDLCRYASGYNYNLDILNEKPLSVDTLRYTTADFINRVKGEDPNVTESTLAAVFDFYSKMEPVDVFVYGVWLPKKSLVKMCQMSPTAIGALKRLCNVSLTTTQSLKNRETEKVVEPKVEEKPIKQTPVKKKSNKPAKPKVEKHEKMNTKQINSTLNRMKPFLTEATYKIMPNELLKHLKDIPKYMVRKYYQGRKFDDVYSQLMTAATELNSVK